jgi:glycerophosphoryl diester phosphodiesterase
MVVSFHPKAILETRRRRPDLRTIQHVQRVSLRWAAQNAWGAGFWDPRATRRRIERAQKLGLGTTVYTVNEPGRMRELAGLGVDGIFSDRPALLREILQAV